MNQCILILDDDTEMLAVCKIILQKQNYRVETRTYCDDIIKDIDVEKPAIIFMDFWIPGMGGENAIKLMKQNEATQHIPVILFSANSEIEEIHKRANADGFLRKPFEISTLVDMVKKNLRQ